MLEPRSRGGKTAGESRLGTGRGTLRLRAKGPATVEDVVSVSAPSRCARLKLKVWLRLHAEPG